MCKLAGILFVESEYKKHCRVGDAIVLTNKTKQPWQAEKFQTN